MTLKKLGSFLNISQHKALAQSFIMANLDYCPAVLSSALSRVTNSSRYLPKATDANEQKNDSAEESSPVVWHFCSAKDKHKIDKNTRTHSSLCILRLLFSELLDKGETCTLEPRHIHFICTEIYKPINNIGAEFMNNLVVPNQLHYSS